MNKERIEMEIQCKICSFQLKVRVLKMTLERIRQFSLKNCLAFLH